MNKTIGIISQARSNSSRLPNKVLLKLDDNNSVLDVQISRLKNCKNVNKIIIATTTNICDDKIIDICNNQNVSYFRGDENNVLDRFYHCALYHKLDIIIRITSDCPLIDPVVVDKMIDIYVNNNYDFISNTSCNFPLGFSAEIINFQLLKSMWENADKKYEKEHVMPYIYIRSDIYNIYWYYYEKNYSDYRLTIDTKEDYEVIKFLHSKLYKTSNFNYNLEDCIDLLDKNPNIKKINMNIIQKKFKNI